jgi:polyhydroxyalkanoate synthesis regulator phasin
MSDKDITDAIIRILKKELGAFSDVFPDDFLKDIKKRISPAINDLIESQGFVKKSKYESINKLAEDLEKRIEKLEKN